MMPAPVSPFAHYLSLAKPGSTPTKPVRSVASRTTTKPEAKVHTPPRRRSSGDLPSFAHLTHGVERRADEERIARESADRAMLESWQGPMVADPAALAAEMIASAEKARRPASRPAPTGIAAEMIAAAAKARS